MPFNITKKSTEFVETSYDDFWVSCLDIMATIYTLSTGSIKFGHTISEIHKICAAPYVAIALLRELRQKTKDKTKYQSDISHMQKELKNARKRGCSVKKILLKKGKLRDHKKCDS